MTKTSTAITASVVAGVVIGSAIGAIVKTTKKSKKPKSLFKKSATLAMEAVGEIMHNISAIG
jgi:hypothetical protein